MKIHDFSDVQLLAVDVFRMLEAIAKDGFRFYISNPHRVSPRPMLNLAFAGHGNITHNVFEIPFTFGELESVSSRIISEFFGVNPSHLNALILRMRVSIELNEPFPSDYVI